MRFPKLNILILSLFLVSCGGGSKSSSGTSDIIDDSDSSLVWTAPTTRTNGDLLLEGDLVGYRIYYSDDGLTMKYLTEIKNKSITTYSLENIKPGKYFFALTAVDKDRLESEFSEYVSINIRE